MLVAMREDIKFRLSRTIGSLSGSSQVLSSSLYILFLKFISAHLTISLHKILCKNLCLFPYEQIVAQPVRLEDLWHFLTPLKIVRPSLEAVPTRRELIFFF